MRRREFLQSFAASAALAMAAGCGSDQSQAVGADLPLPSPGAPPRPHVLLLLVDELRFPVHFPAGVNDADEWMAKFMPQTYKHLWQGGVKFANHHVAATACTPSRGVMLTGLYTQQTWLITTITGPGPGGDVAPSLDPAFPTYGKLMRGAGYQTPYFGKFHVSVDYPLVTDDCQPGVLDYLEPWGFTSYMCPDPGGNQGQGEGGNGTEPSDEDVADLAIGFFGALAGGSPPLCATVSFINPHDYEFFWGGTEPDRYTQLFAAAGVDPVVPYDPTILQASNPAPQGFPRVPANWESFAQLQANKPPSQAMFNEATQVIFSGASFDPAQTEFAVVPSLAARGNVFKGLAPFSYWQRGADCYIHTVQAVDAQIGRVLESIPPAIRENLVVVFTSDHGDHVGSHGFLNNKVGTAYSEALRIPLVVRDFTGRYATQPGVHRPQLTSNVDLLRLLVDLGYGDSRWLTGENEVLYGTRHDLLSIVRSPAAPGREFACFSSDEFVQKVLNFNASPTHLLAVMTRQSKLNTYSYWLPLTTRPLDAGRTAEFYDYRTEGGRLELDNRPDDPQVQPLLQKLYDDLLPNEIRKPLPPSLRETQLAMERQYLAYASVLDDLSEQDALANVHVNIGGPF